MEIGDSRTINLDAWCPYYLSNPLNRNQDQHQHQHLNLDQHHNLDQHLNQDQHQVEIDAKVISENDDENYINVEPNFEELDNVKNYKEDDYANNEILIIFEVVRRTEQVGRIEDDKENNFEEKHHHEHQAEDS